jgi:hypothetical protein
VGGTYGASPEVPTLTVALDLPSEQIPADQASIIQDFQFVMDSCKRLIDVIGARQLGGLASQLAKPRWSDEKAKRWMTFLGVRTQGGAPTEEPYAIRQRPGRRSASSRASG